LERVGEHEDDLLGDGGAGDERFAQVATKQTHQEVGVLDGQRAIQAHANAQSLDSFLRGVVTKRGLGGVAGQDAHDDKDQGKNGPERGDR
jgi:hypothetical protein